MNAPEHRVYDDVAEAQGFADYEYGASETDNPYKHGTLCHMAWADGWDRGYEHYYRERQMDERDKELDDPRRGQARDINRRIA
jgi:hypothetical protein